ncbi:hypothetical protein NKH77_26935 [Streptomyces sp. M19]
MDDEALPCGAWLGVLWEEGTRRRDTASARTAAARWTTSRRSTGP